MASSVDPIEFRISIWRTLLYLLGAAAFVLIGVWIMFGDKADLWAKLLGAVCVAFFGFGVALFLRELVRPRIKVRIDDQGVHVRQAIRGNDFDLSWSELAGICARTLSGQKVVVLDPEERRMGLEGASPMVRQMREANISLVGSWMVISPRTFGTDDGTLVAEITRHHAAYVASLPAGTPFRELYVGDHDVAVADW